MGKKVVFFDIEKDIVATATVSSGVVTVSSLDFILRTKLLDPIMDPKTGQLIGPVFGSRFLSLMVEYYSSPYLHAEEADE